jgi:uncharacterized protein with GYD domain
MAKYLVHVNYVGEGVKGLLKEGGTSRQKAITQLLESVGGKLEAFYFAFGATDVFAIADLPDNITAAALSLIVNATGMVTTSVTVLLTSEELDAAVKKTISYRAPGQ